ncbi:MAG: hypothetical protein CMJ89_09165 [Planctomycetes bacterium]|jgi:hypothetical protein|nr:hypothetical protein [Planctomycetota bacterium]
MKQLVPFVLFCSPIFAQDQLTDLAPGYQLQAYVNQGGGFGKTLTNGEYLLINPFHIRLYAGDGSQLSELYVFSSVPGLPSQLSMLSGFDVNPSQTLAIVAQQDQFRLFPLPPGNVTTAPIPVPANSFFFEDDQHVLFCGTLPAGDGAVWRLDVATGTFELVIRIDYPDTFPNSSIISITRDSQGDLYVASLLASSSALNTQIVRFDAAVVAGAPPAVDETAGVFLQEYLGFIPIDLEYEAGTDTLFLAVGCFDSGFLISFLGRLDTSGVLLEPLLRTTFGNMIRTTEVVAGSVPGAFRPYQPSHGGTLRIQTIGGVDANHRVDLTPSRPRLDIAASAPGTSERLVEGGPPNGIGLLFVGPASGVLVPEPYYFIGGLPLFFGLSANMFADTPFLLDGSGSHSKIFPDPGPTGMSAGQVVFLNPDLSLAGTSNVLVH